MDKNNFLKIFIILSIIVLFYVSSFAESKEDICAKTGIIVKNMTMLDLWYKRNGGECTIWIHNHLLEIGPEDTIEIFSDLICKTYYCSVNPTYKIYKSIDKDGNCRVRILPDCNLSDIE